MGRFVASITAIVAAVAINTIAMASDVVDRPLLVRTPWAKACLKDQGTGIGQVCYTGAEVWNRTDNSMVATIRILESKQDGKKSCA